MFNQQLVDYIREQTKKGKSKEDLKKVLLQEKWDDATIEESFAHALMSSLDTPPVPPATLLSASATFGQAWKLYKQRFGTFLGVSLFPLLFMIVFMLLIGLVGIATGFSLASFPDLIGIKIIFLVVFAVLIAIVVSVIQVWGQAAMIYAVKDTEEKIGIIESYRRAWKKLLSFWWISLLVGIITAGGFFLFVIPGIVFAVWFSFAMVVLIAENVKGMNALFTSREYVRGRWWAVLWRFLFIGLVYLLVYLGTLLFRLIPMPELAYQIIDFVVSFLFTPIIAIYSFLVYKNLKATKGEVVTNASEGKKIAFILIGLLPIIVIPLLFVSLIRTMLSTFNGSLPGNGIDTVEEEGIFSSLGSGRLKADDAKRLSDIKQIQTALKLFYLDHEAYPTGTNINLGDAQHTCLNEDGFGPLGCPKPYIAYLPTGPEKNEFYLYTGEGSTYTILTDLMAGAGGFTAGTIVATPEGLSGL